MKKIKTTKFALRAETLRVIGDSQLSNVVGGLQASMVTTACPTCAFSCDWAACQPPPSN